MTTKTGYFTRSRTKGPASPAKTISKVSSVQKAFEKGCEGVVNAKRSPLGGDVALQPQVRKDLRPLSPR